MRSDTNKHHETIAEIGATLGFDARREVRVSLLQGKGRYAPQIDVVWSLLLSPEQESALEEVGAPLQRQRGRLAVAAWEVEGSDASTKGMQADLANLRVLGAAYGFLAVNGATQDNLYERAVRLTRTHCAQFGSHPLVALDVAWLEQLAQLTLSGESCACQATPKGWRR